MYKTSKINRKLAQNRQCHHLRRQSVIALYLLAWLILCGPLLQNSSAQEGEKSKPKTSKFATKDNRFIKLGQILDRKVVESSGVAIAASKADEPASAIWTFNDSSGKEKLYRIGFEGRTEAVVDLKGARNRDWEAMCSYKVDDQRFLAVGDVGDNLSKRKSCTVYVMPEPTFDFQVDFHGKLIPQETKVKPKSFEFTYEDGPHNCEAMGYNSADKSYWFVEKILVINRKKTQPGIYVLMDPLNLANDPDDKKEKPKNVAKRIAEFPVRNVTGMAFSDDNKKLVIRSYFAYFVFEKEEGETWQESITRSKPVPQPLPLQTQGEAICFLPDGNSVLVTSELSNAIIWKVLLDDPQPESDTDLKSQPAAKE